VVAFPRAGTGAAARQIVMPRCASLLGSGEYLLGEWLMGVWD